MSNNVLPTPTLGDYTTLVPAADRAVPSPAQGEAAVRYDRPWTIDVFNQARLGAKIGEYPSTIAAINAGLARPGTEIVVRKGGNRFALHESTVDLEKTRDNGYASLAHAEMFDFQPGVIAVVGTSSDRPRVNPTVDGEIKAALGRLEGGSLTLDETRSLAGEVAALTTERESMDASKAVGRYLIALYKERGLAATLAAFDEIKMPHFGRTTSEVIRAVLDTGHAADAAAIMLKLDTWLYAEGSREYVQYQVLDFDVRNAVMHQVVQAGQLDMAMHLVTLEPLADWLDGERPALVKALAHRGRLADALRVTRQMDGGTGMVQAYASVIEKVLPRDREEALALLTECESKLQAQSARAAKQRSTSAAHNEVREALTLWSKLHRWVHDGGPGGTISFPERPGRERLKPELKNR
ncbi:MAG: hypothetical protein AAB426_05570 [Myxococcota bacterium]